MTTQTRRTFLTRAAATEANFEAFYHAELLRVYNFFRYRVGDDQLAENLTSASGDFPSVKINKWYIFHGFEIYSV